MKTKPTSVKAETIEDIVFEGRNKTYGAYEMNKKRRKYMLMAFLISLTGVSTVVAIPFLNYLKDPAGLVSNLDKKIQVILTDVDNKKMDDVLPPPEPPKPQAVEKIIYSVPQIVEKVENPDLIFTIDVIERSTTNPPPDIEITAIDDPSDGIIKEPDEVIVYFPQEQAKFMDGDLESFRNWVQQNVKFTEDAANAGISGKVIIEFCVNSKGEVVDINLLRKLYPDLDKEALRVISESPLWTPAKQGGRPVKQKFTIPITFKVIS